VAEAVDFKKVHTKKYRAWRILTSPSRWGVAYRDRVSTFKDFPTAIIFPEQLLGLNQSVVYCVAVSKDRNTVSTSISAHRDYKPNFGSGSLKTLEEIREYESENDAPENIRNLVFGHGYSTTMKFWTSAIFTSQKDALKYQQKIQAQYLSQIG